MEPNEPNPELGKEKGIRARVGGAVQVAALACAGACSTIICH
jgi:hypothetical protein